MNSSVSFHAVSSHQRIEILDILRGFASLGILLVNIHSFSNVGWFTPEEKSVMATYPIDNVVKTILDILIDTKFITLFTILFGVGFAIQLEKAKAAGINFKAYFSKRMAILLIIACLHAYLLWFGDIIRYYAIAGFFLLLVMNWSPKTVLRIAVFFAVFLTASVFILNSIIGIQYGPHYPALQQIHDAFAYGSYTEAFKINWHIDPVRNFLQDSPLTIAAVFGRVFFGYWLGRIYFFQKPKTFLNMRRKWMWWGLCLGFPCSIAFWAIKAGHLPLDSYWLLWLPYLIVSGLILQSLFYIALVIKLFEKEKWKKRLQPFAWVGRMALTNYLLQSVFGIIIFYGWFPGLRLKGIGTTYLVFMSIAVFVLQVFISRWWLQHHSMGPVEWLWKKLAYPKKTPVKKTAPSQLIEIV